MIMLSLFLQCYLFYELQMVWEQEASLIIMLTTTVERGRVGL